MDYKEKYENAIRTIKNILDHTDENYICKHFTKPDIKSLFEQVFPELRENEDEKIRKELIERLKWELDGAEQQDAAGCSRQKDIEMFKRGIAWLEKQKPIEWTSEDEANMDAVWKACGQVYGIKYQCILGDWLKTLRPQENKDNKKYEGGYIDLTIAAIEEYYGDKNPLTSELVSWIKEQKQDVEPKPAEIKIKFPHYNDIIDKVFGAGNLESWEYKEAEALVHLAKEELLKDLQKEQKPKDWSKEDETMMQNILDCLRKGQKKLPTDILKYESWLQSIKPQPTQKWSNEDKNKMDNLIQHLRVAYSPCNWLDETIKWLQDFVPQPKQEWSEKDEEIIKEACKIINCYGNIITEQNEANKAYKIADKLKSLKPQPKQEWSDVDEYQFNTILHHLNLKAEIYKKEGKNVEYDRWQGLYNWLKSFKPQSHWKPTKEHIETLEFAAAYVDNKNDKSVYNSIKQLIDELEGLM